jgi:hypothetical protein
MLTQEKMVDEGTRYVSVRQPRRKAEPSPPSDVALMAAAVKDLAVAVAARPVPELKAPTALKLTHPDGRVTVIERQEHQ